MKAARSREQGINREMDRPVTNPLSEAHFGTLNDHMAEIKVRPEWPYHVNLRHANFRLLSKI